MSADQNKTPILRLRIFGILLILQNEQLRAEHKRLKQATLEYLIAVLSRTSFLGDFPWHTLLLDTSRFSKFYYVEKKNFAF